MNQDLKLRTIKRASQEVGISTSFLKQLLREGKLQRFRVNSAVYISLAQFERLAQQEQAA